MQIKNKTSYAYQPLNFQHEKKQAYNSFLMQQTNIFFRREISNDLTAWLNFEVMNSYSSERNWGEFNLEEAWLRYSRKDYFKIKAGLLIPIFNNLNDVKNRMPYLPYILRPIVYESTMSDIIPFEDYLPERAFLQLYGFYPIAKFKIDYAAYVGNSETSFINSSYNSQDTILRGSDSTKYVMTGGRFGIRKGQFKLGVSYTFDRDNRVEKGDGILKRNRTGVDLSFSLYRFNFENEYIYVNYDEDLPELGFDKEFYYSTLGYNLTEKMYVFSTYNYISDESSLVIKNGLKAYFFGAVFRPNNAVVLKLQHSIIELRDGQIRLPDPLPLELDLNMDWNIFSLAISVLF